MDLSKFIVADTYLIRLFKFWVKETPSKVDDYILAAIHVPAKYAMCACGVKLFFMFSPYSDTEMVKTPINIINYFLIYCVLWSVFRLANYTNGSAEEFIDTDEEKDSFIHYLLKKTTLEHDEAVANILSAAIRILICALGFYIFCSALGVDLSGFVASLSIGTAAIAFAAKDIFSNMFGSLVILLDKTFKKGEWIVCGSIEGIVEDINLRSISVRTFSGDVILVPSGSFTNAPVINRSRGDLNRIDLNVSLSLDTTTEKINTVVKEISDYLYQNDKLINGYNNVRVYLRETTEISHKLRIIFFTDYQNFLDQKEYSLIVNEVNVAIVDIMRSNGVKFVFEDSNIDKFMLALKGNIFGKHKST